VIGSHAKGIGAAGFFALRAMKGAKNLWELNPFQNCIIPGDPFH
jgi:hypothetical protein